MPTQDQINDVLAKVATYQAKKALSDAASAAAATANAEIDAARAAWETAIMEGAGCSELTATLMTYLDAVADSAAVRAAAEAAMVETALARTALDDALYALTHPPPTP